MIEKSEDRRFIGFMPHQNGVILHYSRVISVRDEEGVNHIIETVETESVSRDKVRMCKYGDPDVLESLFGLALKAGQEANAELVRIARMAVEHPK